MDKLAEVLEQSDMWGKPGEVAGNGMVVGNVDVNESAEVDENNTRRVAGKRKNTVMAAQVGKAGGMEVLVDGNTDKDIEDRSCVEVAGE